MTFNRNFFFNGSSLNMRRWIRSKRREHEKLMINHCFDWKALIASFQFREKGRKKKKRVDWAMWCDVIGFCAFLQQRLISELPFKQTIQKDQSFFPTILQNFRDLMFTCSSRSTTGGRCYKICKIKKGLGILCQHFRYVMVSLCSNSCRPTIARCRQKRL